MHCKKAHASLTRGGQLAVGITPAYGLWRCFRPGYRADRISTRAADRATLAGDMAARVGEASGVRRAKERAGSRRLALMATDEASQRGCSPKLAWRREWRLDSNWAKGKLVPGGRAVEDASLGFGAIALPSRDAAAALT